MLTAKELREKRAEIGLRIREMAKVVNDEQRDFSDKEKPEWDKCDADYKALSRQIEIAERAEAVDADQRAATKPNENKPGRQDRDTRKENDEDENRDESDLPDDWRSVGEAGPATVIRAGTPEQQAIAMQAWMRYQQGYELSKRHTDAVKVCRVNPRARFLDLPLKRKAMTQAEARALSSLTGSAGGDTIPTGFQPSFELAMLQFGGIRNVADILRTATGNPLPWPTGNDSSNKGVMLGENTAVATNTDPTFGLVMWNAYKFTSKMILVPVELLEDSAFDLPSIIGAMCGERIGRIQADYFTTGTGAAQPKGIVTAATVGKTTASATAIKYAELVDLVHSVDPAYRGGSKVGFMFHDLILAYLSKLTDGNGKPIWDNSNQGNLGANTITIAGRQYPFTINQSMASTVATGNKTVLFGDFSKYKIRDVASVRLRRLVERYADSDQEGFVAFARADGNLLDAGTHPVSVLAQASLNRCQTSRHAPAGRARGLSLQTSSKENSNVFPLSRKEPHRGGNNLVADTTPKRCRASSTWPITTSSRFSCGSATSTPRPS
jgi:HK97 family phage major capsid protein